MEDNFKKEMLLVSNFQHIIVASTCEEYFAVAGTHKVHSSNYSSSESNRIKCQANYYDNVPPASECIEVNFGEWSYDDDKLKVVKSHEFQKFSTTIVGVALPPATYPIDSI